MHRPEGRESHEKVCMYQSAVTGKQGVEIQSSAATSDVPRHKGGKHPVMQLCRPFQVTFQDTKVENTPTITSDAIKEIVRSALSDASAKMMSTMEQNILDKLTMRNKSPPRNRSPSPTITCFKCRKPGHYARECPSISPPSSPRQTRCFKCQEYGHIQRDCPKHLQVSEGSPNDTGLGQ